MTKRTLGCCRLGVVTSSLELVLIFQASAYAKAELSPNVFVAVPGPVD